MLAMKAAGVDMLTLANGQTLDMLFEGMQQTIANCKTAEMDYIGAFASEEEFETPKIVDVNGINVGFLNYTTSMGGMEEQSKAEAMTYGVATTRNTSPSEDVKKAKEAGAEVVVAYISWGQVGVRELGESEFNAATALAQAGVDVLIGFHPHTVIPPRWFDVQLEDGTSHRMLCLCATGNFLSDQRDQYTCNGIVFEFTIEETSAGEFEITNPTYIPTYVWRYEAEGRRGLRVPRAGRGRMAGGSPRGAWTIPSTAACRPCGETCNKPCRRATSTRRCRRTDALMGLRPVRACAGGASLYVRRAARGAIL